MLKRLIFPALAITIALAATIHAFAGTPSISVSVSPAYAPGWPEIIHCSSTTPGDDIQIFINGSLLTDVTVDGTSQCPAGITHTTAYGVDEDITIHGLVSNTTASIHVTYPYAPAIALWKCPDRHTNDHACTHAPPGDHVSVNLVRFVKTEQVTVKVGGVAVLVSSGSILMAQDIIIPVVPDGSRITAVGAIGGVEVTLPGFAVQAHGVNGMPSPHRPSSPSSH